MAEIVLYPAASGDDGEWNPVASFYSNQWNIIIGRDSDTGLEHSFIRFPSAAIPQGAVISSAILSFVANASDSGTSVKSNIYGNDVDDATAPTNYTEAEALNLTSAVVAWDDLESWTAGSSYNSPDIKTVIQEIVSRPGWVSGNGLMIVIRNNGSTTAHRKPRTYDYGSGFPALTINIQEASETIEVPSADLILNVPSGIQILPIFAPAAALTLTPYSPTAGLLSQIANAPELSLSSVVPSYLVHLTKHPDVAELTLAAQLPSYVWSIPARLRPAAQVIYTCTLTGDGESPAVSDLTLPMSSFQGRMRDGDPSYISAVIPNCMVYADDILARQNGDIVIKKGYRFQDGTTQLEEIARVDFESVRIDQGSKSASATISGHKTISSSSVKTITVEGVSYYCLQADGKRRVRALLDLFLRIGDTCVYGTGTSDYLTVGYITYTVSVNQTIMEVTEA